MEARLRHAQSEHTRLTVEAERLARVTALEAQECTNMALARQIKLLSDKRKEAQLGSPVVTEVVGQNPGFLALTGSLELLNSENFQREKQEQLQRE